MILDQISVRDGGVVIVVDEVGKPSDYPTLLLPMPTFFFSKDANLYQDIEDEWKLVDPDQWEYTLKPPVRLIRTTSNVLMEVRNQRA